MKNSDMTTLKCSYSSMMMEVPCSECSISSADENSCYNPVVNAVRKCHAGCLKLFLAAGADVNATDVCDLGLLSIGLSSSVQPLRLTEKRPVNSKFKYMYTALIYASRQGDDKCVQLLLEAGVNVNSVITYVGFSNNFRFTPICGASALIFASRFGHYECVKLLIQAGADVNIDAQDGCTALIACTISGCTDVARLLLKCNAHINRRTETGRNALTTAITDGESDTTMLLYAAGEILNETTMSNNVGMHKYKTVILPRNLRRLKEEWCLKHLCRETIRNHLINLNPNLHLFDRVSKLGLPSLLTKFVLYNISLHSEDTCY